MAEKKKKEPGIIEKGKRIYGMGKAIYNKYMADRKKMTETRPKPGVRKIEPKPPGGDMKKPIVEQPPKKKKGKKPRGGVGGVLDTIQERKRRMEEALGD